MIGVEKWGVQEDFLEVQVLGHDRRESCIMVQSLTWQTPAAGPLLVRALWAVLPGLGETDVQGCARPVLVEGARDGSAALKKP